MLNKDEELGNSLAVQWLEPCAFTSRVAVLIPGQGAKILQAVVRLKKKKKKDEGLIYKRRQSKESTLRRCIPRGLQAGGLTALCCSHLRNGENSPFPHRAVMGILHYCSCQSETSPTTEMLSENDYYCLCHPFSHPNTVKNARTCPFR